MIGNVGHIIYKGIKQIRHALTKASTINHVDTYQHIHELEYFNVYRISYHKIMDHKEI